MCLESSKVIYEICDPSNSSFSAISERFDSTSKAVDLISEEELASIILCIKVRALLAEDRVTTSGVLLSRTNSLIISALVSEP